MKLEKQILSTIIFLLLISLFKLPYSGYILIRTFLTIGFGILAYNTNKAYGKTSIFTIIYIVCAILFQPLLKIHLNKPIWSALDVLIALMLIYRLSSLKSNIEELLSLASKNSSKSATNETDKEKIIKGFGRFGLDITNPIPVAGILAGIMYLSKLRTEDNTHISYNRHGSNSIPNIHGLIDKYEIYKEGTRIADIYISSYNRINSKLAPEGFILIDEINEHSKLNI